MVLNLVESDSNQLVLPLLGLDLLLLVCLLFFQIIDERVDPVNFIVIFVLKIKQVFELFFVPHQLFLHPDNSFIIIKLLLLVSGLVLEHLELLLDFTHVGFVRC